MPDIPFNVLTLDAAAGGQFGVFEGKIKGQVVGGINITASACHGVQLGLDGKIGGLIEGRAQALFVGAQLRGEAAADAGAKVILRLEPNLFEQMGLSIEAGAYARAYAAGSVAIYLTPEYFAKFINDHFDDFTGDLFLIFLEEVYAEVGVWGKIAFSAMAEGHFNLVLDMQNLDSGFEISGGFNAGLKAGTGWDFYAQAGFRDLRRALLRSSLRISAEVEKEILKARLPQANHLAFGCNFTLPLVTLLAYDLGRASYDKGALLSKEEVAGIVFDDFVQNLQRFAIDRLLDMAIARLHQAFFDLYYRISGIDLSDEDTAQAETEIRALIEVFDKGRIESTDIPEVLTRAANLVDLLDGDHFEQLKQPLTLFWLCGMLSLQAKSLLDEFYADIGISNSLAGSLGVGGAIDILPRPPEFVKSEVKKQLGDDAIVIGVGEAVDYLVACGAAGLLSDYVPEVSKFRNLLSTQFGLGEGDIVEDLLRLLKGEGSVQQLNSYTAFEGFVRLELIQELLLRQAIPQLRAEVNNPAFAEYLDEVVAPSLLVVSDFIFDKLDDILIDDLTATATLEYRGGLMESLSSGCGVVVWQVLARNILFFDEMITDFVLANAHQQFGSLKTHLSEPNHPYFQACKLLANQGLPGTPNLEPHAEALRVLLYDCVAALEELTGPTVYTLARRKELTRLKRELLLSIGGSTRFQPGNPLEDVINEMIACNVPDIQRARATELGGLMIEIGVDSLEIIAQRILPSLADFYLKITLTGFTTLRQQLLDTIDGLHASFQAALEAYQAASDAFREEVLNLIEALESSLDELGSAITEHLDSDWETAFKVRLRILGETQIRNQGLPPDAEQAALLTFHTVDWLVIEPAAITVAATVKPGLNNFIATLDDMVDNSADAATAFVEFVGDIENAALNGLQGLSVAAGDGARALVEVLFPTSVMQQIQEYLAEREAYKALQQEKLERETELEQLRIDKDQARDRYHQLDHNDRLEIEMLNPRNDFEYIYPASTPITLFFRGFSQEMLIGNTRRVQLRLNAGPFPIAADDLTYDAQRDGYLLHKVLPQGSLLDGLNILEVSWIHGDTSADTRRLTTTFVVDGASYFPPEDFVVEIDYDPPGRDVDQEYFSLLWQGGTAIDLSNWTLLDKADHRYTFPTLILQPGERVSVYTGGNPDNNNIDDADKVLYMGRGKAIWNNEGDTAFLIRNDAVLVLSASYVGMAD